MKPCIIFFLLFCFTYTALAQEFQFDYSDMDYAIINDADGFVNIRSAPNATSSIIGKILKYNVFSCQPNKTNWYKTLQIVRDKNNVTYLEGYIFKTKVSFLTNFKKNTHAGIIAGYNVNNYTFKSGNVAVTIEKKIFDPKRHRITRKSSEIILIDGNQFWGTDGPIPKYNISSVLIVKNGRQLAIPDSAYHDLYEPNLGNISICKGPENTFYVMMLNSDGAGGYQIIWIFKDDKYLGRYVDDSEA